MRSSSTPSCVCRNVTFLCRARLHLHVTVVAQQQLVSTLTVTPHFPCLPYLLCLLALPALPAAFAKRHMVLPADPSDLYEPAGGADDGHGVPFKMVHTARMR